MNDKAEEFLKETNTSVRIKFVGVVNGFPNDDSDKLPRNKYTVRLRRGENVYEFPFYDSYYDYKNHLQPTEYDVLAALTKHDVGEMADFVEEYGYVIKDRKSFLKVEKTWLECRKEYNALCEMFEPELMEKLQEII